MDMLKYMETGIVDVDDWSTLEPKSKAGDRWVHLSNPLLSRKSREIGEDAVVTICGLSNPNPSFDPVVMDSFAVTCPGCRLLGGLD